MQNIERESANRSLFTRELILGTLSQTLPELLQQQSVVQTPISSATTATTSPETPNANTSTVSMKKLSLTQEAKRDQTMSKHVTQTSTQQSHTVQSTAGSGGTGLQSQGLPPNSNNLASQNTPMVQTLMHSVLPQPLVSVYKQIILVILYSSKPYKRRQKHDKYNLVFVTLLYRYCSNHCRHQLAELSENR